MRKELKHLEFNISGSEKALSLQGAPKHYGVVASGDLEMIITPSSQGGVVKVKVTTPTSGYDKVWEAVLNKFVSVTNIKDALIEINDNNATPAVVMLRLSQGLSLFKGEK